MKRTLAKWVFALAIISFTFTGCYVERHRDRGERGHDDHHENHDRDHGNDRH